MKLLSISAGRYYLTCDHFRSIELYLESIKPITQLRSAADDSACAPQGVVCRDWETFEQGRCADCSHTGDCGVMGYHSDLFFHEHPKNTYRQLYLKTADEKPFCRKYAGFVLRHKYCIHCLNVYILLSPRGFL